MKRYLLLLFLAASAFSQPRASRITVSPPNDADQVTIIGSAGAVSANAMLIAITLETGHYELFDAAADGSFAATLTAPAGTSILIKEDAGHRVLPWYQPSQNPPLATIPGTIVRVPEGASFPAFATAGTAGRGLPHFTVTGSLDKQQYAPGESIQIAVRIAVRSASATGASVETNAALMRVAAADGAQILSQSLYASSFLTPTGLPIEREMPSRTTTPPVVNTLTNNVATTNVALKIASDQPAGLYRPYLTFVFNGLPAVQGAKVMERQDGGHRNPVSRMNFPVSVLLPAIRIGSPASPRLTPLLLGNTFAGGARGIRAIEDRTRFGLAPRVATQSDTFVIPRADPRNGSAIAYSLEPFFPIEGLSDRGDPPAAPLIPLQLPSGSLTVRIDGPDGTSKTIGPAAMQQWRLVTPTDPIGELVDRGGGNITDLFQLTTLDPRFETTFERDGRHVINVDGSVDDRWGRTWAISGTFEVWVARPLLIEPAVMPGTSFETGDRFRSDVHLYPPLPAEVTVQVQHAPNSDASRMSVKTIRGNANRFGSFGAGDVTIFNEPGEYRADITATYRDAQGTLWMGSQTWGGVVAPKSSSIIAHGRRGIDDSGATAQPSPQQWFTRTQTGIPIGDSHMHIPFGSGDVSWLQKDDAVVPVMSFHDLGGDVVKVLKPRCCTSMLSPNHGPEERWSTGEGVIFSSRPDDLDPALDPSKVDLWGYAYRAVERPLVHVRQIIGEEQVWGAYWRFSSRYGFQPGVTMTGDLPNDFKMQFGGVVFRGSAIAAPRYAIYGSLFVLVPNADPRGGTRTLPPFQNPLFTLKGKDVTMFLHPTSLRAGTILQLGETISFTGQIGPMLPAKVSIVVTSPSGRTTTFSGQANSVGYFAPAPLDVRADEAGLWRAKVSVLFDGTTSAGAVSQPYPTGDVLGSRDGELNFYVVAPDALPLAIAPMPQFVRPADGPLTFVITPPVALTDRRLTWTTTMPGFILEEGTSDALTYTYDARKLATDFPNLDTYHMPFPDFVDPNGPAGADVVTISLLLSGTDATGTRRHFARQIVLKGEELMMPAQPGTVVGGRRRVTAAKTRARA